MFIATATAKSLQSCTTLCDPIPGIFQARVLEWGDIAFSGCMFIAIINSSPLITSGFGMSSNFLEGQKNVKNCLLLRE